MAFQDDVRESDLVKLFQLVQPPDRGRSDTDAFLEILDILLPFEVKSTSRAGVTTVRDFGPDHVYKWKDKHWLIGVYNSNGDTLKYALYGSPIRMRPWIAEKEEYISYDFALADCVPMLMSVSTLDSILGSKDSYTLSDARKIHKRQFKLQEYKDRMDLKNGYSPSRMLDILRERCAYIIRRGSTLNNPHIPASYFNGWPRITVNHAETLRHMVQKELANN